MQRGGEQQWQERAASELLVLPARSLEDEARNIIVALGSNFSALVIDDERRTKQAAFYGSTVSRRPSTLLFVAGLMTSDCHADHCDGGMLTSLQHVLGSARVECIPNNQDDGTFR
jgi:hypothetical protein